MRLVRHLSFSNVIAVLALFIALGGAAYAGSKINGKNIVNKSIGGGKLKNETITANKIKKGTITSAQIAPGSIDSTQININTLTTVPSATTATSATTAKTAETATKATSAITADEATEAGMAEEAENAKHAKEADNALHANEADTAKHAVEADVATTAANATHATDADTIEGESGEELRNELKVGCAGTPKPTEAYGGMCWEKTTRPISFWLVAVKTCGNAGGRLPLISELIAYLTHDGNTPGSDEEWSGSLLGTEKALTSDDNENVGEKASIELGYRCVYPLTN